MKQIGTMKCPDHLVGYRIKLYGSYGDEQNGAMLIKPRGLKVIFSNGGGWEHLSVSKRNKTPSYEEMDRLKREFWGPDDVVMQLHVAEKNHINDHDYCLHLWRPTNQEIPLPPEVFV